jgi:GH43 family beta-xylosidase
MKITKCLLAFQWHDGETESMYESLPEYLRIEINRYLQELEELRERDPDEYLMFENKGEVDD